MCEIINKQCSLICTGCGHQS